MATTAEVVKAYFDAILARDLDAMCAVWKPGSIDRMPDMADLRVPEDLRAWFGSMFTAFPDFELVVQSMISEGDTAAVLWKATGTFDGEGVFEGFKPNGRRVEFEGLDMLVVEDGLIVSNTAITNGVTLARQIGAMPPAGSLGEKLMLAAFNSKSALQRRLRGSAAASRSPTG